MRIGTFEPGTEVLLRGKWYRIHKVVGVEGVLLIDEGSGSLRTADPQALDLINPRSAESRGRGIDLADVPEEHWAEAKRRRDLVAPLAEKSPCPAHLAAEVANELGVGIRQVYNLIKLYRQRNGVVTAFLKGGKGRSRRTRVHLNKRHESPIAFQVSGLDLAVFKPCFLSQLCRLASVV